MKKVGIYLLLSLLTILIALGVTNHEVLFEAIKSFPKDWIFWYGLGTLNTTLVLRFIPKNKIVKKTKAQPTKDENK